MDAISYHFSVKALKDTWDDFKSSANISESTSPPAESFRIKEVKPGKFCHHWNRKDNFTKGHIITWFQVKHMSTVKPLKAWINIWHINYLLVKIQGNCRHPLSLLPWPICSLPYTLQEPAYPHLQWEEWHIYYQTKHIPSSYTASCTLEWAKIHLVKKGPYLVSMF